MSGANMSVVWGEVVKCFATGCAAEGTLGDDFFVGFQVAIEDLFA